MVNCNYLFIHEVPGSSYTLELILEVLVFEKKGKPARVQRKTGARERTNNKLIPHNYGFDAKT